MTSTANNEEFNGDELEAPEWLNAEFFTRVLTHSERADDIRVLELKIMPASAKGDHYASVMFRAEVGYRQQVGGVKRLTMIIKTMPEIEGPKKELLQDSHIFETEIGMYTEVIPRFHQILRDVGDETTVLGPRCLYHSLSPKKLIILEDIVPQGFSVLRGRSVNMQEAQGAYMKLAKLHAISYKLNEEEPSFLEKYCYSIMSLPNIMEMPFVTDGIKYFIELSETESRLKAYKKYFEPLRDTLLLKICDTYFEFRENRKPLTPYVLCHGDFHGKNLMFKNNPKTGALQDTMLLDFQLCYIGPMINDLLFSRYALLNDEQRVDKWDELLYFYYSNFCDTLKKINFEGRIPKLRELRHQLLEHKYFQLFLATTILPLSFAFIDGNIDPQDLMTNGDIRRALYFKEEYITCMEKLLKQFLHLGYLE